MLEGGWVGVEVDRCCLSHRSFKSAGLGTGPVCALKIFLKKHQNIFRKNSELMRVVGDPCSVMKSS